ncbi:AP2 domain-containing protein [Modicisalibacter xianhensis]|uniref:AP2 domain-containing protein n=1 Tax=Modicisalibacter xianhensis TaxID=442341 RepID=A0A4R8FFQ9_9GAMM|nr:HNH endonuclease signature motif containing protein [Halomonas xianhensis]TDX21647.1 AP2 domain-containing protein [Halomonas xianhensis]
MKTRYIDPEVVRELLHYDPDTGTFTWRERPLEKFKEEVHWKRWNSRFKGKKAGCIATFATGYQAIYIRIGKNAHYAHRLAWVYMTGDQPPKIVDHINRDATDNRWGNIRSGENNNCRNRSMYVTNTSGVNGVTWSNTRKKWVAQSKTIENGRHKAIYLGGYEEMEDAIAARRRWERENGYAPDHGRDLAPYHVRKGVRHV